jgi:replicative DNA helicase
MNELMTYGKVYPQAIELESSVLGSMMINANLVDQVLPILETDDFYLQSNQIIFNAILQIFVSGGNPGTIQVTQKLKDTKQLETVGGSYYVTKLTLDVWNTTNIERDCYVIKQKSVYRKIIEICGNGISEAFNEAKDVFELETKLQLDLSKLFSKIKKAKMDKIGDVAVETYKLMREASQSKTDIVGISSGFSVYDRHTSGLIPPDLIILAGDTGEGKSTFALNVSDFVASKGFGVAFFSLEMSKQQLMWKLFSARTGLTVDEIRRGQMDDTYWKIIEDSLPSYHNENFFIHDEGGLSVQDFRSIARTLKAKHDIRFIVVDYLQLMKSNESKGKGNREQEVSEVSRELKECAKELNIPIMALSQLSRLEKGTKRMYKRSDLRESGAIEHNADQIIFLFRPSYHKMLSMDIGNGEQTFDDNDVIIQFEKMRLGQTGLALMKFLGSKSKFIDLNVYNGIEVSTKVVRDISEPIKIGLPF